MNLTEHFTLEELTRSDWAIRNGVDNTPSERVIYSLKLLCMNLLEPIRLESGRPILVTSGYRSSQVNAAIGGSHTSQHILGEAADFTVDGRGNLATIKEIIRIGFPYDQLIYEFGDRGWIHASYRCIDARRETLEAYSERGATHYRPLRP